jgi:hypothetical protein
MSPAAALFAGSAALAGSGRNGARRPLGELALSGGASGCAASRSYTIGCRRSWSQRHGRSGSGKEPAEPRQLKALLAPYQSEAQQHASAYVVARIVLWRPMIQTPALMSRPRTVGGRIMQTVSDDPLETVIAEYIRANGVSRCPTACVSPTQGWVPTADRMALAEYAVARDRRRERPAALNPADAEREDGLAKRSYRRLSPEQVARCRDWNENMSKLADEFGVSPVTIFKVRQRYTYKELP